MSTSVGTSAKSTITITERIGTGVSIVAVLALVFFFVFPHLSHTLRSSNDISSAMTTLIVSLVAAAALGLIGAALGVPALLRERRLGRGVSTGVAVAALITATIVLFVSVLPHVQDLQNLQHKVEPFGFSMRDNCGTPLQNVTNQFMKISTDASNNQFNSQAFGIAMKSDLALLIADEPVIKGAIASLQAATLPASKYQDLLNRCISDSQKTMSFLTSASSIPISPSIPQIESIVDLDSAIPSALKPVVKATIEQNLPSSLSSEQLLALSITISNETYLVKLATGLPSAEEALASQAVPVAQQVILGILPTFVNTVFVDATNASDHQLTREGDQLLSDIVSALHQDLPGFNLDTAALTQANR